MKKLMCALLLVLFVTGCDYKYSVVINKKKNIVEKLELSENNSTFSLNGSNVSVYINSVYDIYSNNSQYSNYDIEKNFGEDVSGVIATANYEDFRDYKKNNKVKKTLFGKIDLYEENSVGYFIADDYRGEAFFADTNNEYQNESVEFNLILPYEVKSNNADKVDAKNGVYTWYFDDSVKDKNVNIEFNLKKIVIKENIFVKYWYFMIIPIVIFGLIFCIFIKNKRVNKI